MRVSIVGQGRAGSTFLWRLAHYILSLSGESVGIGVKFDEEVKRSSSFVYKTHGLDKRVLEWADVLLSTRRDLREALDSYERVIPNRVRDLGGVRRVCTEMIGQHSNWEQLADREVVYEEFRSDPYTSIRDTGRALGVELSDEQICGALIKLGQPSPKKPFYIPQDWIEEVESEFGWWLEKYGYIG